MIRPLGASSLDDKRFELVALLRTGARINQAQRNWRKRLNDCRLRLLIWSNCHCLPNSETYREKLNTNNATQKTAPHLPLRVVHSTLVGLQNDSTSETAVYTARLRDAFDSNH